MNRHRLSIVAGILLVFAALAALSACGGTPPPPPTPTPTPVPLTEFGVNSLNDPREPNGDASEATAVGAVRDRWVVEWFLVEQPWRDAPWGEGAFNWQGTFPPLRHPTGEHPPTAPIDFDIAGIPSQAELPPLVALHGIPRLYDCTYWPQEQYPDYPEATSRCGGDTDRIEGLFEPALQGDEANPDNKWARFVFETVSHLVQEKGITTYQIWNEPDQQWLNGGPLQEPGDEFRNDYVRMVRVAGEAAEQAGGDVLVLGAPSSDESLYEPDQWIYRTWSNVDISPTIKSHLDAIAIHSYDWPFQTWSIAEQARGLITDKPVWVTESGLTLCDSPACGGHCTDDEEQQAAYLLQQFAYARVADVAVDYHFRMYDDPRAFGLRPAPGGAERPVATAARLATQYLSAANLADADDVEMQMPDEGTRDAFGNFVAQADHTRMVFESPDGERRVTVLWANREAGQTVSVTPWSAATHAELRDQANVQVQEWESIPEDGYSIPLEEASPISWVTPPGQGCTIDEDNDPVKDKYQVPAVGGHTLILIESRGKPPQGEASVICRNGRAVGTDLQGYDADSGLASLSYACSPEKTYDLS
jgi:hypothetical protein